MNRLDLIIIVILAYYALTGMRSGLLIGLMELAGFVVSAVVPFLLYIPGGRVLLHFGVSPIYSNPLAFFIIWIITLNLFFLIARRVYKRIPKAIRNSWLNRTLGTVSGLIRGIIVVAVVLTTLTVLPMSLISRQMVDSSRIAPPIISVTTDVAGYAADIFGEALRNRLGLTPVEPKEGESLALKFKVKNPNVDPNAEEKMLNMLNKERTERGLKPLILDETLRKAARKHSIDMLQHGYFAHNTPDGITPFQRMRHEGSWFMLAGENLAFAQTVLIAHRGLMESPGHRENILRPQFHRVGIGTARGGPKGTMFTQDFAD